jgi:hypothetical protein
MANRILLSALLLFLAPLATSQANNEVWDPGNDRLHLPHETLILSPDKVIRLEKEKKLPKAVEKAQAEEKARRAELDKKLKLGTYAIIQGSVEEWNNEVVRVVALYADGSRKVELANGKKARVAFANLNTLSPETTSCCESHGQKICKDQKVYHPMPSSSIGVPEGKVAKIFDNCTVMVHDGIDFVYSADQLGKPVDCSPERKAICKGRFVLVEGFVAGVPVSYEGPVLQVYTNGLVLVQNGLFPMPVDVKALTLQTEALGPVKQMPAVLTSREVSQKIIPTLTLPELEPLGTTESDEAQKRHGVIPAQ